MCRLSGVIGVTTAGTAVTSRAAPTRRASSTSSPARTAAAFPMTLSAMATMTAGMNLMSWSTCAIPQHPPAPPASSDVTMDTVSPWARCATGTMTVLTTATRRDAVRVDFLLLTISFKLYNSFSVCLLLGVSYQMHSFFKKDVKKVGWQLGWQLVQQSNYRTAVLHVILILASKCKDCI